MTDSRVSMINLKISHDLKRRFKVHCYNRDQTMRDRLLYLIKSDLDRAKPPAEVRDDFLHSAG